MRKERLVWRDFGSDKHRQLTTRAMLSDKDAEKSYKKLQAKGLTSTELLKELVGMAVAVACQGKSAKLYSGWGMTQKTLAYFPTRLRGMAVEIERLNAHPLFIPDGEFMGLPAVLRDYADHLDERLRLLRRSRKGRPGPLGQVLDGLRWLVRKETGKERLADLARLLTAVANGSEAHEFDFEATLKMNAYRHPVPLGLTQR